MDSKGKERIALKFIEAAREASEFLSSMDDHKYDQAFLELLTQRKLQAKREAILVSLLEDATYVMKFSEEFLDQLLSKKIRDIIYSLLNKEPGRIQRKARKAAEDVFKELDTFMGKHTTYLPVSGIGLDFEGEKLELGNITLQKMTQERIDEAIEYLVTGLLATANDPEDKQQFINIYSRKLQSIFENTKNIVWAIYHDEVEAEPIRAKQRAVEECYRVFDLLRYSLPMLYSSYYPKLFYMPPEYRGENPRDSSFINQNITSVKREQGKYVSFGLKEDIGESIRHVIMFSDQPGFNWETRIDDSLVPLILKSTDIEVMAAIGVFEVSKILKGEEDMTNFKRTLLRSIHWFANAQTQMQPEYVFLSLVLQSHLSPKDDRIGGGEHA